MSLSFFACHHSPPPHPTNFHNHPRGLTLCLPQNVRTANEDKKTQSARRRGWGWSRARSRGGPGGGGRAAAKRKSEVGFGLLTYFFGRKVQTPSGFSRRSLPKMWKTWFRTQTEGQSFFFNFPPHLPPPPSRRAFQRRGRCEGEHFPWRATSSRLHFHTAFLPRNCVCLFGDIAAYSERVCWCV